MQGFTYIELTEALQAWPVDSSPEYVDDLDRIIELGELRLIKDLNIELFDTVDTTVVVTAGSVFLTKPTGLLSTRSLRLITAGTRSRLTLRSRDWLENYSPNHTTSTGTPKYFTDYSDTQWQIAPVPLVNATVEAMFVKRPASIVTSDTTWLGNNCGELLFASCLMEAEHYLKADDRFADMQGKYTDQLEKWKLENRQLIRHGDYNPLQAAATKV